jgi:hypothetical protein
MLGISLYIYLYLKLAKNLCVCYYLLWYLVNKIGEEVRKMREVGRGEPKGQEGEMAQTMCLHI